jgi:hypothetical protein
MSASIHEGILTVSFPVAKERLRKFYFEEPVPHMVYHLYVNLAGFKGKSIPDGNNPRSHEDPRNVAKDIMRDIEGTLIKAPEQFGDVNRGGLAIVQNASYDAEKQVFTCHLTDWQKRKDDKGGVIRPMHGLADGGTTDLVIYELQRKGGYDEQLSKANLHLEVMVFADTDDKEVVTDFVAEICEARNTSRQVKSWTMLDWRGEWNWLREVLNPVFPGKIAYEENGPGEVTVMDVLAVLNLFRPIYNGKKVPTVSYSSKGRMQSLFEDNCDSFKVLKDVAVQILDLHDHIYSTFNSTYARNTKRSLRRYCDGGTKLFRQYKPPKPLVFSPYKAELEIDKGLRFPVLAAFQAMLDFNDGTVKWFMDPKSVWKTHGPALMEQLVDAMSQHQKNPQSVGKDANVYRLLWTTVYRIRQDEEMKHLRAQLAERQ